MFLVGAVLEKLVVLGENNETPCIVVPRYQSNGEKRHPNSKAALKGNGFVAK